MLEIVYLAFTAVVFVIGYVMWRCANTEHIRNHRSWQVRLHGRFFRAGGIFFIGVGCLSSVNVIIYVLGRFVWQSW